jgi:HK97 family phage prohead protease
MPTNDASKIRTVEGWLIKYESLSEPVTLPSGRKVYEVISSGAFNASVDAINAGQAVIECNVEHTDDALCRLGITGRNVTVQNRPEGVYGIVQFIGDTVSSDVFARIQAGIVSGMSVEFTASPGVEASYSTTPTGDYVRRWSSLILRGFAITAAPAYPEAQITKATDGVAYVRSIRKADVQSIVDEVAKLETRVTGEQRIYEYEKFLLGIR